MGVPPIRGHEHQINHKEEAHLICQTPYKYSYYQKSEIEKIVKELLEVGSIQNRIMKLDRYDFLGFL